MGAKRVYVVNCRAGMNLDIMVDGKRVTMDEFLQTHEPIQVSSLTPYNPGQSLELIGLMIAESKEKKKARVLS